MRKLSEDIWICDGESVPFLSLPFTTRMTVIRLSNNDLWVHSPIKISDQLLTTLNQLGKVKYLIAANHLHHLYLLDWQSYYPNALCYGTDELIKKRPDISFNSSLNDTGAFPWAKEILQMVFTGSPLMQECLFFHRTSKVLVVTDLIENFPPEHFNFWQRLLAKAAGILAPNGKMPIDWRISFIFTKPEARKCLATLLDWHPKIIVMAHGVIIESHTQAFLKKSFNWLK